MSYKKEFNAEDYPVPSCLKEWCDLSWFQDSCPSFFSAQLNLVVWVDHKDPVLREANTKQYTVVEAYTKDTLVAFEKSEELEAFLINKEIKWHLEKALRLAFLQQEPNETLIDAITLTLEV